MRGDLGQVRPIRGRLNAKKKPSWYCQQHSTNVRTWVCTTHLSTIRSKKNYSNDFMILHDNHDITIYYMILSACFVHLASFLELSPAFFTCSGVLVNPTIRGWKSSLFAVPATAARLYTTLQVRILHNTAYPFQCGHMSLCQSLCVHQG
jgi:hypothetical protein